MMLMMTIDCDGVAVRGGCGSCSPNRFINNALYLHNFNFILSHQPRNLLGKMLLDEDPATVRRSSPAAYLTNLPAHPPHHRQLQHPPR
jgi:hypothetical protein